MRFVNDPRMRAVLAGIAGGALGWLIAEMIIGAPKSFLATAGFGCLTGLGIGAMFGVSEGLASGSRTIALRGAMIGSCLGILGGGVGAGLAQASYARSQGNGTESGGSVFSAELQERLRQAGAKAGEVEIGLFWKNKNDLDLHVVDPLGERIFFGDRISSTRGELDVDRNAGCGGNVTNEPVEHIVWPPDFAPKGKYKVEIDYFQRCTPGDPTDFRVEVGAPGHHKTIEGMISNGERFKLVHEFEFGGKPQFSLVSMITSGLLTRVVGWTLFGLLVGAGQGLVRRSGEAIRNLSLGGAIGGATGGLGFLLVSAVILPYGFADTASRLLGMMILGAAIGLCMVIAEQTLSAAIIIMSGRYEGRRISLDRPQLRLGRNELFEIYLGGDPAIAQHHCTFVRDGRHFMVCAEQGEVTLNGALVSRHQLSAGDLLRVGNTSIAFKTQSRSEVADAGSGDAMVKAGPAGDTAGLLRSVKKPIPPPPLVGRMGSPLTSVGVVGTPQPPPSQQSHPGTIPLQPLKRPPPAGPAAAGPLRPPPPPPPPPPPKKG